MAAKKNRAPELDFLRGFALILMFIQHVSYDLKYEFGVPGFNYLESNWFWAFVHPSWLVIFVGVSGICCTFSRNNLKRGLKLLAVAAGLTLGTYLIQRFMGIPCLIVFNVLALLSLSILLYTFVQFIEKKAGIRPAVINVLLGAFGAYFTVLGGTISNMDYSTQNLIFLPVGFAIKNAPAVADYMNLFPWLGVFMIGCVIGRVCYSEKKSLLTDKIKKLHKAAAPVEFIGRHSLIIYLVHQPVVYGILYLIFTVLGKIK